MVLSHHQSSLTDKQKKMSSQRILLAVALLASVFVVALSSKPNHVSVGNRGFYDHIVHNERVKVEAKWMRIVKEKKTFSTDHGENITMVNLLDQNQKGNGATATILAGGPGFKYVTAQFKSKRGHSIDFIVELFGR